MTPNFDRTYTIYTIYIQCTEDNILRTKKVEMKGKGVLSRH